MKANQTYTNSDGETVIVFCVRQARGSQYDKARWQRRNGDAREVYYYAAANAGKKRLNLQLTDEYTFEEQFTLVN